MVDGIEPLAPAFEHVAVLQQRLETGLRTARRLQMGTQRVSSGPLKAPLVTAGRERTRLVASTKDCTCGFCRSSDMFSLFGVPSQLTVGPTRSTSGVRRWVNSLCQVTSPCTEQISILSGRKRTC